MERLKLSLAEFTTANRIQHMRKHSIVERTDRRVDANEKQMSGSTLYQRVERVLGSMSEQTSSVSGSIESALGRLRVGCFRLMAAYKHRPQNASRLAAIKLTVANSKNRIS